MSALLGPALDFAMRGWAVVPAAGKRPLGAHGYRSATTNMDGVRELFAAHPNATGLGVAAGPVSGLLVLDVDPRHGGDVTMRELVAKHGALPATPRARTGGGGWHLYFAYADAVSAGPVGRGVEIKGDGGGTIAPPSVHPSGDTYRWIASPDQLRPQPIPVWLGERAAAARPSGERLFAPGEDGERNSRLVFLAGVLISRGITIQQTQELLRGWATTCRPPLPGHEVDRTVASVGRTIGRRLLSAVRPFGEGES